MTDDKQLAASAEGVLKAFSGKVHESPTALPQMLAAGDFHLSKPRQIIIAGTPGSADVRAMLEEVASHYLPNRVLLGADGGEGQAFLGRHVEVLKDIKPIAGRATAYVCENYACQQPTNDLKVLREQLR